MFTKQADQTMTRDMRANAHTGMTLDKLTPSNSERSNERLNDSMQQPFSLAGVRSKAEPTPTKLLNVSDTRNYQSTEPRLSKSNGPRANGLTIIESMNTVSTGQQKETLINNGLMIA